jgi:hypothetical protein
VRHALHFVGFRDDAYLRAIRVFGRPDFIHRHYDRRCVAEIAEGDTMVFATGDETQPVIPFTFDDSAIIAGDTVRAADDPAYDDF